MLLTPTSAGPGTSATGVSVSTASLAAASLRFLCETAFFLAGAFVTTVAGAVTAGGGVAGGGVNSGAFVCANKLVETVATKTNQICFFIIQPSKVLISVSVNVRQRPGFSSPNLILPICVRC